MKYKVIIDPKAAKDMDEIFLYVSLNDSLLSANQLLNQIEKTCFKLEKFPNRGHAPKEIADDNSKKYLEIYYKPYRIVYEIKENIIYIHAVIEGRRDIQEILSKRLLR